MFFYYLLKIFIYSIAVYLVSKITNLIYIKDFQTAFLFSIVIGIVNFLIKPIFVVFTLPITMITFGIFLIFINGLMIMISAKFFQDIKVNGCFSATLAGILISIFVYLISEVFFGKISTEIL